jgi:arsenite methyltransferase
VRAGPDRESARASAASMPRSLNRVEITGPVMPLPDAMVPRSSACDDGDGKEATAVLQYDDESSRRLEAAYLTPDVVAQRRIVRGRLELRPGERVLDVGVGPGFLAAEMAGEVGADGMVAGIDVSESMLALAKGRDAAVDLRAGSAASIPYPDAGFDVAVSTQVLEYVADVPAALAELRRVVRPGGRILILDTDWDSIVWRSGDDARMAVVLAQWEGHLADPRLPRRLLGELRWAGFTPDTPLVLPLLNVGFDPVHMFSARLIDIVGDFVAERGLLPCAEVDAWRADLRSLGDGYFFSLNRYVFRAVRD